MKKSLLFILLLFPFISHAQWQTAGQLQISRDTFNVRASLGKYGYIHIPKFLQIDSIINNAPTKSVTDVSGAVVNTRLLHNFSIANAATFDSLLFVKVGPDSVITLRSNITLDTVRSSVVPTGPTDMVRLTDILVARNASNFGITGSLSDVAHYANSGGDNTYEVGGFLNLLPTSSSDSVKYAVTWTDNHSVSQTIYLMGYKVNPSTGNMGTVRDYALQSVTLRAKDATTIQLSTIVSGAGSILYEVGGWIKKIVGDGGL